MNKSRLIDEASLVMGTPVFDVFALKRLPLWAISIAVIPLIAFEYLVDFSLRLSLIAGSIAFVAMIVGQAVAKTRGRNRRNKGGRATCENWPSRVHRTEVARRSTQHGTQLRFLSQE